MLLNEHNFHDYVINADTHELILDRSWFLNFYAPWCDHCQNFEPIWEDFHAKNKEYINVASIDCSDINSKVLCMEYGIMNYPSLRFIPLEFDFDRKKPVMHAFN